MAWLDEADQHAAGRIGFALDDTQTRLGLMRSAVVELGRLVPSDVGGWNRIAQASGALEHVVQIAEARARMLLALASNPPPGTAVVLLDDYGEIQHASHDADRWLAEHFGAAEHHGWLPEPVASWLALPPRPALQSMRDGRRLTIRLLPGQPHALLLEEEVGSFRAGALEQLGLTGREREVLEAAPAIGAEAGLAEELFLSPHAVRERLERLEDKLGVHSLPDAIAAARRASL